MGARARVGTALALLVGSKVGSMYLILEYCNILKSHRS